MSTNKTLTEAEKREQQWKEVLESDKYPKLNNNTKANCIKLLENATGVNKQALNEDATPTGDMAQFTPVVISLIRRTLPTLITNDIVGVQALSVPTGLIFAQRVYYGKNLADPQAVETWRENAPDATYSGAYSTEDGEKLGQRTVDAGTVKQATSWKNMTFSIDSVTVTCKTRALRGVLTTEVIQDLRSIHGLDAEQEIANILQTEVVAEIDREVVDTIRTCALAGAQKTTTPGTWDASTDTDGRWEAEKYLGLLIQIEKEAAIIAQQTRRGRGNFIITSAAIAGALAMAGVVMNPIFRFDAPETMDIIGISFQGVLAGRFKMYVDPYITEDEVIVGYKGANNYDSGIIYAPYQMLQFMKATGEEDFSSRIGVKSRYGIVANPYADNFIPGKTGLDAQSNPYYRKFKVTGI